MRYPVRHPIILLATPKGARTRQIVIAVDETNIEIPELDATAEHAVSLPLPKTQGLLHDIWATDEGFYSPVTVKGSPVGIANSRAISAEIGKAIGQSVALRVTALSKGKDGQNVHRPSRMKDDWEEYMKQPAVSDVMATAVDQEAYALEKQATEEFPMEFAFIGGKLQRSVPEPFYSIGASLHGGYSALSIVTEGKFPTDMLAAFRIDRREEALEFGERLREQRRTPASTVPLAHSTDHLIFGTAAGRIDDIGMSVAATARGALSVYSTPLRYGNVSTRVAEQLLFDGPLEHIMLARELRELTHAKAMEEILPESARLVEVLREIDDIEGDNPFNPSNLLPIGLVCERWDYRDIGIDVTGQTFGKTP